ncbi:DNA topoisomerase 3-beta isoform X2 [Rosa chinensis]|uniref:DNA topoisomerase 3-beta isoform X2 n=1 Tax=Rosa chinensis TaxID=74649 RepID=UPI001AD8C9DB|nr:DNA topoisomerase 3-beta isoform X2 [Rosa chinensis]
MNACILKASSDAGDHPPVTPLRSATEDMLGNDAWRLYEYVCKHFIGTVSPDCKYVRTKAEFSIGGEFFHYVGQHILVKGFTSIMPWLAVNEKNLPQFTEGEKIEIARVDLHEVQSGRKLVPTALADLHKAVVFRGAPWKAEIGRWLTGCGSISNKVNIVELIGGSGCKNDCSGRGFCNRELGQCRCFHGYSGQYNFIFFLSV